MHLTGSLLIILDGVMEGLLTLPVKLTPRWSWENIWGLGSLFALILIPVPLLLFTVPDFYSVYTASPMWAIVSTALFGIGWGLGGIFFGLGIAELGLSLGTSSIMALIAIGGSVIPLIVQRHGQILSKGNIALMLGICIMLVGLMVCSRAGSLKLLGQSDPKADVSHRSFGRGIFYCIVAGLLSALVNFALIFGIPISQAAKDRGVAETAASNAIWAIAFTANYLVNVLYCVYLMRTRNTFCKFSLSRTGLYWLLAIVMGLLWAGGIVVYGLDASSEGEYGPVFAFPMMLIVSILTANLVGVPGGMARSIANCKAHHAIRCRCDDGSNRRSRLRQLVVALDCVSIYGKLHFKGPIAELVTVLTIGR